MNHLKRLALSLTLICALTAAAFAGETGSQPCAPGETSGPPCAFSVGQSRLNRPGTNINSTSFLDGRHNRHRGNRALVAATVLTRAASISVC